MWCECNMKAIDVKSVPWKLLMLNQCLVTRSLDWNSKCWKQIMFGMSWLQTHVPKFVFLSRLSNFSLTCDVHFLGWIADCEQFKEQICLLVSIVNGEAWIKTLFMAQWLPCWGFPLHEASSPMCSCRKACDKMGRNWLMSFSDTKKN